MRKIPELHTSDMAQVKKKQFWSAVGAIGGSLLSGLFGSAANDDQNAQNWDIAKLNYKSQQETNAYNRLIAEDSNKANLELQNDMNDFNLRMWNKNNEYNSPAQQLQRAAAAGINPNVVFGQPVASSPVQQTSIPNMVTPQMEAPLMNFNPLTKGKYKFLQELGNMFAKLPFNKASLDIMKEEARGKAITNDLKAEELDEKKNEKSIYQSSGFVVNPKDNYDMIPVTQYDELPESEKKKYEKDGMPNYIKYSIRSRAGFEALKDVMNLPNFLTNINSDRLQSVLRSYVAKHQISAKDAKGNPSVIYAIAHMPEVQYENLVQSYRNLLQEYNWNSEDRDLNKKILELQYEQIERNSEHDFFKYIDKIGSGEMTAGDWIKMLLVGIHDMLGGSFNFIRKR